MTVQRFLSRAFAGCLALVACLAITACASFTGTPGDAQVAEIKNACAIDAGLRPTVKVLLVLATPDEQRAVTAAETVIDTVCANPSGSLQANTLTVFSESTAQIMNVVATLQSRKARAARSPSPGASSSTS